MGTIPPTSQCGEHVARGVAAQLASRICQCWSDCSAVVSLYRKTLHERLAGGTKYAGIFRDTLQYAGHGLIQDTLKVKSHLDLSRARDMWEACAIIGNTIADREAKQALQEQLECIDGARNVTRDSRRIRARTMAATVSCFPPCLKERRAT